MKNLSIVKIDDKYAIVSSDVKSIVKNDNVYRKSSNSFVKAEEFDGMIGYTGFGGYAFLWFREGVHFKLIKFITQKDIKKLI